MTRQRGGWRPGAGRKAIELSLNDHMAIYNLCREVLRRLLERHRLRHWHEQIEAAQFGDVLRDRFERNRKLSDEERQREQAVDERLDHQNRRETVTAALSCDAKPLRHPYGEAVMQHVFVIVSRCSHKLIGQRLSSSRTKKTWQEIDSIVRAVEDEV